MAHPSACSNPQRRFAFFATSDVAEREGRELTSGTLAFIEDHIERVVQPTRPLW
jgi:hypothetical protein